MWFNKGTVRNFKFYRNSLRVVKKLVSGCSADIIIPRRNNIGIYCFDYRLTRFSTKNRVQKVGLWQREQGKGTRNSSPTSLMSVPGRSLSLYVNLCHRKRKRERIEIGATERGGGEAGEWPREVKKKWNKGRSKEWLARPYVATT